MNQRIKELAEQAERLVKDELAHLERIHNRLYSFTEGREIYNQKFAELIVRECLLKIENERFELPDFIIDSVKQHFGVEE